MQPHSWYVLHVFTGKELDVRDKINRLEMDALAMVPVGVLQERRDRRWVDAPRVLLPGYVFLRAELAPRLYYAIRGTPGVIKFLGMSSAIPATVTPQEMEPWLILGNTGQPLMMAEGIRDENGVTTIRSGPLAQMNHSLIAVDARQRRAKLELYIHGGTYTVTIGIKVKSSQSQAADESSPRDSDGEQSGG